MSLTKSLSVSVFVMLAVMMVAQGQLSPPVGYANHLQCSNGIDDDHDGFTDFPQDPECATSEDPTEADGTSVSSSSRSSSSVSSMSSDLTLLLSDGRDSIGPSGTMIYAITLSQRVVASKNVTLTLELPEYAQQILPDRDGAVSGKQVTWANVTLPQNSQQRFSVQVVLSPETPHGILLIARAMADGAVATDGTLVQDASQQYDVFQLSLTDDTSIVPPRGTLNYHATVSNTTASQQVGDVILTVPQLLVIEVLTPDTSYDSNVIVWKDTVFAPNETKTFTFRATVRRNAPEFASLFTQLRIGTAAVSDTTSVQKQTGASSASSAILSSSRSSVRSRSSVAVNRSVLFRKTSDANEVLPGGLLRYTLFVQNVLLQSIDDATITDTFDASKLSIADAGGGNIIAPDQLQWVLPTLSPGHTWQQTYSLIVSPNAHAGITLNNVATITGTDTEYATLAEKVSFVKTDVVERLPSTGAPYDVFFLLITFPMAILGSFRQRTFKV